MTSRYIKFPGNTNFVILRRQADDIKLSDRALSELKTAHGNSLNTDGWSILPARAKIAIVLDGLMRKIRILRHPLDNEGKELSWVQGCREAEPFVWEAIDFLEKVVDVCPFRDSKPE